MGTTIASSLRSVGSLLGDPTGAPCPSTVLIRLSSVWSRKHCRTQANASHLKDLWRSAFQRAGVEWRCTGARLRLFRPAREQLEFHGREPERRTGPQTGMVSV